MSGQITIGRTTRQRLLIVGLGRRRRRGGGGSCCSPFPLGFFFFARRKIGLVGLEDVWVYEVGSVDIRVKKTRVGEGGETRVGKGGEMAVEEVLDSSFTHIPRFHAIMWETSVRPVFFLYGMAWVFIYFFFFFKQHLGHSTALEHGSIIIDRLSLSLVQLPS